MRAANHTQNPMSAGANSLKAVYFALGGNFAIAVAKFVAAAVTGSSSMLAEAVHSSADCGNQLLLLLGLKRSKRPPSHEYPLGYGKEIYFWSFIVALMLFSLGGMFSIYEGWHKLHSTEELSHPLVALGVLAFGIAAESVSMWGCLREVNKIRGDQPIWTWFRRSRNAELVVIFGEDLAALLGLTLAFIAVLAAWITGNVVYDAYGSIAIGVLLVVVAVMVAREVKALLIGQGVEVEVRQAMIDFIAAQPRVEKVLEILTLHMGADVAVAVKVKMAEYPTQAQMVEGINVIERDFKERFPQTAWIFFEPDTR
jgi:cation diffusion facilitator family transporter